MLLTVLSSRGKFGLVKRFLPDMLMMRSAQIILPEMSGTMYWQSRLKPTLTPCK